QCGNNVFQLNANEPATADGETGTWTSADNVSIDKPNLYNTTVTLNGTAPTTATLTWTISNGVCDDKTSTIKLTLNEVP
ncbi:hypothetical protein, partial [Chitinophaga qingshengii]